MLGALTAAGTALAAGGKSPTNETNTPPTASYQSAPLVTPDVELWLGERLGRFGEYEFAILGGRPGYPTPTGAFAVEWKSRSWWSKQWNAEMPYSMFFKGGAAMHEGSLGVESHGCVHLSEKAARYLYYATVEGKTRVFVYP
ncbi:MAG: L,D-transpeptidase [Candidatus Sumerlaeota bacterium]|nr:L,D-transpeptidase [Candidatus Sumerlaeota bacterium]